MAALPQGAFAAYKLRANEKTLTVKRKSTNDEKPSRFVNKQCKYNKNHDAFLMAFLIFLQFI
jgi:hypothetical protein